MQFMAHTVRFWPRFGRLRQILNILKDSYNPRLKSVVFDHWFDMFTDSRLMTVVNLVIKFHLRRNSVSVRRFGTQSCSVTSPTMNVKLCLSFKTELILDNYCISHKLRRSHPWLSYSLTLMNWDPTVWHDHRVLTIWQVQRTLKKITQCVPGLKTGDKRGVSGPPTHSKQILKHNQIFYPLTKIWQI